MAEHSTAVATDDKTSSSEGNAGASGSSEAEKKIVERLETLSDEVKTQSAAGALMADPQVRAILEARQRGEEVQVVSGKKEPEAPEVIEPPEDIDTLSHNELSDFIIKSVSQSVGARVDEAVEKLVSPLVERVKGVEGHVNQTQSAAADKDIRLLKRKYGDFDEYKQAMVTLHGQAPGLSVEQYYLLAKNTAGSPVTPDTHFESEKPTVPPQTKLIELEDAVDGAPTEGRAGFEALLNRVSVTDELSKRLGR